MSAAEAPANGLTREKARTLRALEVDERRNREAACALDFRVYGDDDEHGPHAERCICTPVCSRDYDPEPYEEANPVPHESEPGHRKALEMYAGTSIGALYGLSEMTSAMVAELAGWNIRPRSVYE